MPHCHWQEAIIAIVTISQGCRGDGIFILIPMGIPMSTADLQFRHAVGAPFMSVVSRQRRSEGGAGRTGRHLLGAANGRKLVLKIHVKIHIVISYVFACNKNNALQLQSVPILTILGCNIGSLAASAPTLLSHMTKPKTKGRQIWPPPRAAKGPATPLLAGSQ